MKRQPMSPVPFLSLSLSLSKKISQDQDSINSLFNSFQCLAQLDILLTLKNYLQKPGYKLVLLKEAQIQKLK